MLQEIFVIPHRLGALPTFGLVSWSVVVWLIIAIGMVSYSLRRHGWGEETQSAFVVAAFITLLLAFVMPMLEAPDPLALAEEAPPRGLPIRGYGVMMLCGIVAGVLLAAHRARQIGLDPEHIYSLMIWMFVGGIVGARTFFVVQYWEQFRKESVGETIAEVLKFTEGGLVVYGAMIGSLIAWVLFCRQRKLTVLAVGDIIAPALMIGLALGRIGCLANGCCFGGICESPLPAIRFPQSSPPYQEQLKSGRLLGVTLVGLTDAEKARAAEDLRERGIVDVDEDALPQSRVVRVAEGSVAAEAGVKEGDRVRFEHASGNLIMRAGATEDRISVLASVVTMDGTAAYWTFPQLPTRSLPTHPAQIYSSITALLLCAVAWFAYPFLEKHGGTMALVLTLYPISRFLLEWVRVDEGAQFGTTLTISQLVSFGIAACGIGLFAYVTWKGEARSAW